MIEKKRVIAEQTAKLTELRTTFGAANLFELVEKMHTELQAARTAAVLAQYATAQETAAVMRQATPDEKWLNAQLDRIAPNRFDADVGESDTLVKLVFELRDAKTRLQGEAKVMRTLLEESLKVLATLEPEDDNEHARLESLKKMIVAIVEAAYVVRS